MVVKRNHQVYAPGKTKQKILYHIQNNDVCNYLLRIKFKVYSFKNVKSFLFCFLISIIHRLLIAFCTTGPKSVGWLTAVSSAKPKHNKNALRTDLETQKVDQFQVPNRQTQNFNRYEAG